MNSSYIDEIEKMTNFLMVFDRLVGETEGKEKDIPKDDFRNIVSIAPNDPFDMIKYEIMSFMDHKLEFPEKLRKENDDDPIVYCCSKCYKYVDKECDKHPEAKYFRTGKKHLENVVEWYLYKNFCSVYHVTPLDRSIHNDLHLRWTEIPFLMVNGQEI